MISKRMTPSGKTRWVARWRDPSGREHSKTFDTRRDAKAHVDEMERSRRIGTYLPDDARKTTVRELFDQWIESRPLRESSRIYYEHTRDKLLGPIADYPAREVTPADIHEWAGMLANGRPWIDREDKGMSATSVRNAMRHVRTAYGWGLEHELVGKNPVKIPPRSQAIEPDDIPTIGEIYRVVDAVRAGGAVYEEKRGSGKPTKHVQGPRPVVADMMLTATMTGMRISELCGLLVREVDLDARIIRVRRQLSKGKFPERVELKTPASRRDIPVADDLVSVLVHAIGAGGPDDYVFRDGDGRPLRASRVSVVVARAAGDVRARRVHFHALRHYFASALLTEGVPIQDVSSVLGHKSPALTLGVYTHVIEGARERVAAAISSAVSCGLSADSRRLRAVP